MPNNINNRLKIALVHHWLPKMRGGERVLEAMCEMFPDSDIFTLVMTKAKYQKRLKSIVLQHHFFKKCRLEKRNINFIYH